jgi:hypothetical protein
MRNESHGTCQARRFIQVVKAVMERRISGMMRYGLAIIKTSCLHVILGQSHNAASVSCREDESLRQRDGDKEPAGGRQLCFVT